MTDLPDLSIPELENIPVSFGLVRQGHFEKIVAMLQNGSDWDEIASAISWDRATARTHFEAAWPGMPTSESSTKDLRAALAIAIETIRNLAAQYGRDWHTTHRLAAVSVYCRGDNLLPSRDGSGSVAFRFPGPSTSTEETPKE